jgi:hypothetical protein
MQKLLKLHLHHHVDASVMLKTTMIYSAKPTASALIAESRWRKKCSLRHARWLLIQILQRRTVFFAMAMISVNWSLHHEAGNE